MSTVLDSLNSALHRAFQDDERVLLLGEDVLDPYGGAFKVSRGLSTAFPGRVLASPISEAALVGAAAGMALRGLHPVVEIMFGDFITLAADQVINHAAKFRWMYNDQVHVPLVIRTPMGGRRGYGPTHSQTLEKLFLGAPGVTVVAPVNLGQPGDLLYAAILKQEAPLLFVENKLQYLLPLLDADALSEFDVSMTVQAGLWPVYTLRLHSAPPPVITLAAYGYMAELARLALLKLAYDYEIFAELVIPTRLSPFDTPGPHAHACARTAGAGGQAWTARKGTDVEPLLDSVARTRRLLTIEEGTLSLGWGAEVLARCIEAPGTGLQAARRLAAPDLPLPAASSLEQLYLPGVADVIQWVREMV